MSLAILCDQCHTMLRINERGDDEYGERAAWITLGLAGHSFEVCTSTCAVLFLQREDIADLIADQLEVVAGIARIAREEDTNQ